MFPWETVFARTRFMFPKAGARLCRHFLRLHFQDQVSVVSVNVIRGENTAVCLEPSVSLVPAIRIEAIEVVSPMEFKIIRFFVEGEHLHIVVEKVPRHINWLEAVSPWVVRGRPEVHSQRLGFVGKVDCPRIVLVKVSHLPAVYGKGYVFGCPFHLVDMPFIVWVEIVEVFMLLLLLLAVSVDHVCREWIILDRRHNLNVKLVPACRRKVRTVPIGKK